MSIKLSLQFIFDSHQFYMSHCL